ncbi:MAG: molybdopterin-guanine dinucleotide biosynthesis protein B [Pseudomonadota bacterium]
MTHPARTAPRIGIVGWKNSGKTTLAAALISELTNRGFIVASVKSAHHAFQIDNPSTDSAKHAAAGAAQTAILGGQRWAIMNNRETDEPAPSLDDVLARMSPCDVVLVEGFKKNPHPKIEVCAQGTDQPTLADHDTYIMAIACDRGAKTNLPTFKRDDVAGLTDFICNIIGKPT